MATLFRAQMSNCSGRWRLFVVLLGVPVSWWPEADWGRSDPVPAPVERDRALAELGYKTAPGCCWEWFEDSDDPDDPSRPVRLIATVDVLPVQDGGTA
ncbi:DUF6303 family protein [Streptomyces roseoverticillatus]|uniref:DUF6303 family protein n=1 Tax=Streptomyces roseoverticillatus TaxID=66429 RepID=UPI0004BFE8F0|nr:DUF6303 family protein [Streptomyces roseoverticillatus]